MTTRRARLLIMSGGIILLAGCRAFGGSGEPDLNPEVLEELRQRGEAPVMVALVPPAGQDEEEPEGARSREAIARLQDNVLRCLEPEDFRLRHRFEAVPAFAGTVLSERGLRVLSSHPGVARVDLDVGGGGAPGTGNGQSPGETP